MPKEEKILYQVLDDDKEIEIEYVYHLSDIHIRNAQQHREYKEVFERTYKELKKQIGDDVQKSLIVLTGDIMHDKTDLKPEAVTIARYFLKNLTDIASVIMIAGNHDCNVSNKNKMDALFPIVDDGEKYDNYDFDAYPVMIKQGNKGSLYYLRKSGFYVYSNIIFGVTSVFDKKLLTAKSLDKAFYKNIKQKNKYKIALYHGTVDKAQVDSGYKLTNRLNTGDFEGYDYVMLGDVHKYQYLDNENTIAYAGSLIQQSHGETIENHGFLKWFLLKNQTQHFEIPNDYGYCTIEIINGKMEDTYIPNKPRIRFTLENTTRSQFAEIQKKLEEDYEIQGVTNDVSLQNQIKYGAVNKYLYESNMENNADVMHLDKIKKYLQASNFETLKIKSVLKLHKQIYNEVIKDGNNNICNSTRTNNCQSWDIIELRFSNLFSFAENNVIDFTKFESNQIIGIFAPNHYGKSSIIDIILYCLFAEYSRGGKQEVMNENKKEMFCSLQFKIGSKMYLIERFAKRPKTNGTYKSVVKFYSLGKNSEQNEDLTCDDVNDTNKKIREMVGDYKDYIVTCVSLAHGDRVNFTDMNHAEKKKYLQQILNLNVFKHCSLVAKNNMKKMAGKKELLDQQIKNINVDKLNDTIRTIEEKLYSEQNKLIDLNNSGEYTVEKIKPILIKSDDLSEYVLDTDDDINRTKIMLKKKLDDMVDFDTTFVKKEITKLKLRLKNIDNDIKVLQNEKHNLTQTIINIPNKFNNFDIDTKLKDKINLDNEIKQNTKILSQYSQLTDDNISNKIESLENKNTVLKKSIIKCMEPNIDKLLLLRKKYNECQQLINETSYLFLNSVHIDDQKKQELLNTIKNNDYFIEHVDDNINKLNSCINGELTDSPIPKKVHDILCSVLDDNKKWIQKKESWKFKTITHIEQNYNDDIDVSEILLKSKKISEEIKNISLDFVTDNDNIRIKKNIKNNKLQMQKYEDILNLRHEFLRLNERFVVISEDILEYYEFEKHMENNETIRNDIDIITKKIEEMYNSQKKTSAKIESYQNQLNNNNIELQQYLIKKKLHALDMYELSSIKFMCLDEQFKKWCDEKKLFDEEIDKITKQCDLLKYDLDSNQKNLKTYCSLHQDLEKINKRIETYTLYTKVINYRTGLPCEMIKNCLSPLSDDINKILHSFTEFSVQFVYTDEKNEKTGKVNKKNIGNVDVQVCRKNKRPTGINLASGFEKFVIGLSMRIALTQLSMSAKPNFFIIDEGWNCMDRNNRNNVSVILEYFRKLYDHVIIISHLDELQEQAKYVLSIEKDDDKFSHINNQSTVIRSADDNLSIINYKKSKPSTKKIIEV